MIRPTTPADTPDLLAITEATNVFKPSEIQALREVLDDYHSAMFEAGHRSMTFVADDRPVGFAYYAPASMTDRTWYLYWIVVSVNHQGNGVGSKLLQLVEKQVRDHEGRLLLIETSSLPHYRLTREFYLKHGYEVGAVISGYYADHDDMVVFRKRLSG